MLAQVHTDFKIPFGEVMLIEPSNPFMNILISFEVEVD